MSYSYDISDGGVKFTINKKNFEKFNTKIKDYISEEFPEVSGYDFYDVALNKLHKILGVKFNFDKDGNITTIFLEESPRLEFVEALFIKIADVVDAGSYITCADEYGECWRWIFDGKGFKEVKPKWE